MRFALLALVGLLFVASDASAFFGRRVRAQRVVVQPQRVVVAPQRVVVGGHHAQAVIAQPVVVQQQLHHAQPVIVSPARVFFAR